MSLWDQLSQFNHTNSQENEKYFLLTFFSKPYWYCSGGKALSVILGHKQSKRYLVNSHYRRIIMYASTHSTPTSVSVLDHLQPFTQLLMFLFPCIHPSPPPRCWWYFRCYDNLAFIYVLWFVCSQPVGLVSFCAPARKEGGKCWSERSVNTSWGINIPKWTLIPVNMSLSAGRCAFTWFTAGSLSYTNTYTAELHLHNTSLNLDV